MLPVAQTDENDFKMKNFISLIFCSFLLLASCGKSVNHNVCVQGTIEGGINDGENIYLMLPDENSVARVVASTTVVDGRFVLAGNINLPAVCNVVTATPDGNVARKINFIAEGGDVAIKVLPEYYRVSGTPLNDALQACRDTMEIAMQVYARYYSKKAETPTLSQLGVKEANDVMAVTSYRYREVLYRAIASNIDNILAAHLIKEYMDIIEPSRGLQFIKGLSKEYVDNVLLYINSIYSAQVASAVGTPYINITMPDTNGVQQSLSSFVGKGKPVVLNVWVSSSKSAMEAQAALSNMLDDVEVVSVSIDGDYNMWRSATAGLKGAHLNDLKGWGSPILSRYGIDKVPYYILVDADGRISYRGTSFNDVCERVKR